VRRAAPTAALARGTQRSRCARDRKNDTDRKALDNRRPRTERAEVSPRRHAADGKLDPAGHDVRTIVTSHAAIGARSFTSGSLLFPTVDAIVVDAATTAN